MYRRHAGFTLVEIMIVVAIICLLAVLAVPSLLRAYYKIHYARMQALASTPELKTYLQNNLQGILRSLDQPRVRPNPTPAASPSPG